MTFYPQFKILTSDPLFYGRPKENPLPARFVPKELHCTGDFATSSMANAAEILQALQGSRQQFFDGQDVGPIKSVRCAHVEP